MNEDKIVAAILTGPIILKLGGSSGDIPPDVAVSVYEEVLLSLQKLERNKKK